MLFFENEPKLKEHGLSVDIYEEYKKKLIEYNNQIESLQISYWLAYFISFIFILFIFYLSGDWTNFYFYIAIYLSFIGGFFLETSDFFTNIIRLGEYNKLKKEKEKLKNDFYNKVSVFENDLKNYYQHFLQTFFEENLYRKKSGNEKFEAKLNLFADIIKKCEDVNKFLITKNIYLHDHERYLEKRQRDHSFNEQEKIVTQSKLVNTIIKDMKRKTENIVVVPPEKKYLATRKIDWEKINKSRMAIGRTGEEIVLEVERKYLLAINRKDLADKICHVSVEKGDGAGYDILSFFENGKEKYVEVKSTKYFYQPFFNISRNELNFLQDHGDNAFIYQVSEVESDEPKLKIVSAKEILNSNQIMPTQFIVKI